VSSRRPREFPWFNSTRPCSRFLGLMTLASMPLWCPPAVLFGLLSSLPCPPPSRFVELPLWPFWIAHITSSAVGARFLLVRSFFFAPCPNRLRAFWVPVAGRPGSFGSPLGSAFSIPAVKEFRVLHDASPCLYNYQYYLTPFDLRCWCSPFYISPPFLR